MTASPFAGKVVLSSLTVEGNLPFRRLCVELGAEITVGEMAVVRKPLAGSPSEFAPLKSHPPRGSSACSWPTALPKLGQDPGRRWW